MDDKCFNCKKELDVLSVYLTDGGLCSECFEKVKEKKDRITRRNIGMYSCEEIMNIINPPTDNNKVVAITEEQNSSKEIPNEETEHIPEEETECALEEDDIELETKSSPFALIKTIGWTMLVIILIVCAINPSFLEEIAMKVLNKSNAVYIEMVQTLKPFDNTSYYEAFEDEFDNNEWSYFEANGKQIVQVISTYNDIDDEMITQFLLTPQGNDQFYIEPYAVNVSGVNLSYIERNMAIAALFEGDLSQVLIESLLYGE